MINFKTIVLKGHSHQNNYKITFTGSDLFEITNTMMFNVHKNQINYNKVIIGKKIISFKTKKGDEAYVFNSKTNNWYWFFLILIIPALLMFNKYLSNNFINLKSFK